MSAPEPKLVEEHLRDFFAGHAASTLAWLPGPTARLSPGFRVLAFEPGPRINLWAYASVGACAFRSEPLLEFVLLSDAPNPELIELLAMAAYYHLTEGLGEGHTLPIGRPWLPGAACSHFLVSLPYPFGPTFEVCSTPEGEVRLLWLLPITDSERAHKVSHGLEALESKFDEQALEYWRIDRPSVI